MSIASSNLSDFESAMLLAQQNILALREIAQAQEPDGGPLSEQVQQSADRYDELREARREMKVQLANMQSELYDELTSGTDIFRNLLVAKIDSLLELQE